MNNLINFLTAGILAAAPLLFGVLGETLTEKSGNMNLGVEGMMFMGGIAGILGPYYYEKAGGTNPYIALIIAMVCALVCAGVGALVFSVLTITLRANQNVTGLALTMFGTGFGNYFGEAVGNADPSGFLSVSTAVKGIFNNPIFPDSMVNIPYIGKLLFSHNFMVYLAILLAVLLAWFLGRTRAGLSLRAVGESPATADAAGINVTKYKYLATCIGGAICALGQLIQNGFLSLGLAKADAGTATSICLIFLSALLTGLNLYNSIARFAGAGTLVPITGFANSVVSPAIDFKSEGFITGMASKMFVVAGPVIVFGTLASGVYGVILMLL